MTRSSDEKEPTNARDAANLEKNTARDSFAEGGHFSRGAVIGERFVVEAFIGAGAVGQVYKVYPLETAQPGTNKKVERTYLALKILMGTDVSPVAWKRFQTEIEVIARLTHGNVVRIMDSGIHGQSNPYYTMELVEGESLADRIKSNGPLEITEALKIFICAADALNEAHKKNILHRDIKPSNIVIATAGSSIYSRVKVVDFGIAKLMGRDLPEGQALTGRGEIFGSPLYMSPEQACGSRLDNRSDIYSLGCTLFEALTGQPPFKGSSIFETLSLHQEAKPPKLSQVAPGKKWPRSLEDLVDQLLSKLPDDRCGTMAQVEEILESVLDELGDSQSVTSYAALKGKERKPVKKVTTGLVDKDKPTTEDSKVIFSLTVISVLAVLLLGGTAATIIFSTRQKAPVAVVNETGPVIPDTKSVKEMTRENPDSIEGCKTSGKLPEPVKPGSFFRGLAPTRSGAASGLDATYTFPAGFDGGCIEASFEEESEFTKKTDGMGVVLKNSSKKAKLRATGTLTLQEGKPFSFAPEPVAIENPSYMLGFRPGDVQAIRVKDHKENLSRFLETVLPYFHKIDQIDLSGARIDQSILASVGKIRNLRCLDLRHTGITEPEFNKLSNTKSLKVIGLSDLKGNTDNVIARICRSPELSEIYLENMTLSETSIKKIFSSQRRVVELKNVKFPLKAMEDQAATCAVRSLHLLDCGLEAEQILPAYIKFRKLYKLQFFNQDWSQEKCQEVFNILHKARPSVNLRMEARQKKSLEFIAE
ncbi:MAG: serine/threonine-protein kinase [Candidatus Obscuribacter sp.]|nr:serine/threonine-protein kinase [Candidatus Obscuribacter sp.]